MTGAGYKPLNNFGVWVASFIGRARAVKDRRCPLGSNVIFRFL
jgi:hypothetical protein